MNSTVETSEAVVAKRTMAFGFQRTSNLVKHNPNLRATVLLYVNAVRLPKL